MIWNVNGPPPGQDPDDTGDNFDLRGIQTRFKWTLWEHVTKVNQWTDMVLDPARCGDERSARQMLDDRMTEARMM